MSNINCEDRIDEHLHGRVEALSRLWAAYTGGDEEVADIGTLCEYGLGFDYVAAGTFPDQKEAYFRYQLSWGGPSDEFRFFVNPDLSCHRIEFWFLDWFDGAQRTLHGEPEALLSEIWQWFCDIGAANAALSQGRTP